VNSKKVSAIETQIRSLRNQLDTLNSEIRELIKERNERNKKHSEFIKEGKENKDKRDEINAQVKKEIELRREKLAEIRKLNTELSTLKTQRDEFYSEVEKKGLKVHNPIILEKEIEKMEWKLETTVLSMKNENKLVESIREKRKVLKYSEKIDNIRKG
jgi:phosphoserine phosphatase